MASHGGLITAEDLANYKVVERTPLTGTYRDYGVITAPPPSAGGVGLLQMMGMLDGTGYASDGPDSAKAVHFEAEAMRRYYADRSPSKDELAASYLRAYEREFWARFDEAVAAHPGDARAQVIAFLAGVGHRADKPDYRGCGMTNAAVEYPEVSHPARLVGDANKRELRRRLRAMAAEMGAADPDTLGDGLLLLIEGAYISGQLFGPGGPAASVAGNADRLIAASLR